MIGAQSTGPSDSTRGPSSKGWEDSLQQGRIAIGRTTQRAFWCVLYKRCRWYLERVRWVGREFVLKKVRGGVGEVKDYRMRRGK